MVHGQACKTLSIMFAGNKSRVQDAIDIGLIPIIIDMMSNVLFRVKKEALSVVYEAAKVASTEQLTHIGTPACIGHLFNMLTLDCTDLSFVSLRTLKYVSTVYLSGLFANENGAHWFGVNSYFFTADVKSWQS